MVGTYAPQAQSAYSPPGLHRSAARSSDCVRLAVHAADPRGRSAGHAAQHSRSRCCPVRRGACCSRRASARCRRHGTPRPVPSRTSPRPDTASAHTRSSDSSTRRRQARTHSAARPRTAGHLLWQAGRRRHQARHHLAEIDSRLQAATVFPTLPLRRDRYRPRAGSPRRGPHPGREMRGVRCRWPSHADQSRPCRNHIRVSP